MTAQPDLRQLMADTRLYPFQVNWLVQQVQLLQVDPAFYEQAAFLDQRAIQPGTQGAWFTFEQLQPMVSAAPPRRLGLIFHIGHCGSTLLSRALALADGLFSLREPLPLRDLALLWAERDLPWSPRSAGEILDGAAFMRALWARTPAAGQTAVLKATSFCSLLAAPWLARFSDDRAVCLAMSPQAYIATVLGAEGYVVDLLGGAKPRMAGLSQATGAELVPVHALSPGEIAAMTFAAELVAMQGADQAAAGRVLRVDFDHYLAQPGPTLQAMAAHFGQPIDEPALGRILANPVLGRYSKATDYPFSAEQRQQRLRDSRAANTAEIRKGLDWLAAFADDHAILADALAAFGYTTDDRTGQD
ncbi:hypothetical protein F3N42_01165 [Marinihelvus fidelis]|uniref:Sulfotransferase n=1 Tax=Marinihelvus fidelis TaxID=2613842 RepID=A0A5N0TG92_9GAMM|nr:hypothetical protein [Marinihelvus fidelis]KAA9134183.1 hypothetical protein F3N42_01165 [Marinihelvus fidelis]